MGDNMKDKDINSLMLEMKKNSISLKKFLIVYCGLYSDTMINSNISHKDVKILLPEIRRISFDKLVSNRYMLYNGEVIAVKDSNDSVLPYINLKLKIDKISYFDCECNHTINDEVPYDIEDLNIYSLEKLLKESKDNKDLISLKKIRNVILQRTSSVKEYKYKKNTMKGNDKND